MWAPTPAAPALIVVIDEYAELADEAPVAIGIADSIARRGRAVAVTLLAATQRPTQKAMGSGAVRSQMDVRICLRVRERRDVDLILGQGMLAAGWAADTLNAPGKFLLSTPEHTTPRRARAYRVDDQAVAAVAARHAEHRPQLDALSRRAIDPATEVDTSEDPTDDDAAEGPTESLDPETALWAALRRAPAHGYSVKELMAATGRVAHGSTAACKTAQRPVGSSRSPAVAGFRHSAPRERRPDEQVVRADVRDASTP